jgi:hypothetical protein
LRIANETDAMSVVRKYLTGTRSRHGKIASIMIDEESASSDGKGMWAMKGSYTTESREKEEFTASVTSRGEVRLMITPGKEATKNTSLSGSAKSQFKPYRR